MNKSKFITRFKECYKEKGYTQEELAEKLNLSINGLTQTSHIDFSYAP